MFFILYILVQQRYVIFNIAEETRRQRDEALLTLQDHQVCFEINLELEFPVTLLYFQCLTSGHA